MVILFWSTIRTSLSTSGIWREHPLNNPLRHPVPQIRQHRFSPLASTGLHNISSDMLIHNASNQGFVSIKETEGLECCPHIGSCLWNKVIGRYGRKSGCAEGLKAASEGRWENRKEVGLECESIRVADGSAQPESLDITTV